MKRLFITGASGFVADRLLRRLPLESYGHVYCLSRSKSTTLQRLAREENVTFIRGSLHDPDAYADPLARADTVVHLAAATGKHRPEVYFDTNVRGAQQLLRQCEAAGVERFLHVSTIAVAFPDLSRYPYARSKFQAEEVVRHSRLRHAIVRPTIVLGRESDAWKSFLRLAGGPALILFGSGQTKIQPIHADDLADLLIEIIEADLFDGETFELGGPERISVENFLRRIHAARSGGTPPWVLRLPLGLVLPLLTLGEKFFFGLLPVTTGQLSSFRYDSTARPNRLTSAHPMKDLDEMIRRAVEEPQHHA